MTRVWLLQLYRSPSRIDEKTAADDERSSTVLPSKTCQVWSVPLAAKLLVPVRCRAHEWHGEQLTPINLNSHACKGEKSSSTLHGHVRDALDAELLAPNLEKIPWVASGRGASRHSCGSDMLLISHVWKKIPFYFRMDQLGTPNRL